MCLTVLRDASLYRVLFTLDQELAEAARAEGCPCGGPSAPCELCPEAARGPS